MLEDALQLCIFPFDAYAIPEDFVVNTTNTLLQKERAELLRHLQIYGGNDEVMTQSLKMDSLDQIRNLLTTLEWLKNELNQETLSDVTLYYIEDMTGRY